MLDYCFVSLYNTGMSETKVRTLKELIDGSRYSISEIAEFMGVTPAMVYYWRDGSSLPPVPRFAKLCRLLEVPMEGVKID